MLIDYRAFFTSFDTIKVGIVMIIVATIAKYAAAWLTQKTFRMSVDQRRIIFGLSKPRLSNAGCRHGWYNVISSNPRRRTNPSLK